MQPSVPPPPPPPQPPARHPSLAPALLQSGREQEVAQYELVVSLVDFDLSKVWLRQRPRRGVHVWRPATHSPATHHRPHPPSSLQSKLRLDAYLAAKLPTASRARLQASIKGGLVAVNGKQVHVGACRCCGAWRRRCMRLQTLQPAQAPATPPRPPQAKASYAVRPGDVVCGAVLPPPPLEAAPEALPLHIVFEDEHLLVINKVSGWVLGMLGALGEGRAKQDRGKTSGMLATTSCPPSPPTPLPRPPHTISAAAPGG